MYIIAIVAWLVALAYVSEWWEGRKRAKQAPAALQETEALCREQQARQSAYVQRHVDDPRTAGKPIEPRAAKRGHRKAA